MSKQSDLLDYLDAHGPLFAYLGHFLNEKILCQGHNTQSGENDAEQLNKYVEGIGSSEMVSKAKDEPGGA